MHLSLAQFLLGSGPAPIAAPTGGEAGGGDLFAQLLGNDAGAAAGSAAATSPVATADMAARSPNAALGALVMQALPADQLPETAAIKEILAEPVAPQQAGAIRATLRDLLSDEQKEQPAYEQLDAALEQVEQGSEPVIVADIIEMMPSPTDPQEQAPILQRVLGWMQQAFEKRTQSQEAPQQAAAAPAAMTDGALQSLQASLFPAGDVAPATDAQSDGGEETSAEDAAAQAITFLTTPETPSTAIPQWVHHIERGEVPQAVDEAVPALTPDQPSAKLPEVELPSAPDRQTLAVDTAEPHVIAERAPHEAFAEHLQALPEKLSDADASLLPMTRTSPATPVEAAHKPLAAAPAMPMVHLPPTEQVHLAITTASSDGIDRITLQLDPADLGRVEVQMELANDGKTQLHFTVDKAETLDALSRDARSLERSLQEAGIKADAGSMQFNLRQQPQPQFTDGQSGDGQPRQQQHAAYDDAPDGSAEVAGVTRNYILNVREGVDIHA